MQELRLYAETAVLFTLRPGRFALERIEGRRLALNPLAMLATAAGVLGTTTNLLGRLLGFVAVVFFSLDLLAP